MAKYKPLSILLFLGNFFNFFSIFLLPMYGEKVTTRAYHLFLFGHYIETRRDYIYLVLTPEDFGLKPPVAAIVLTIIGLLCLTLSLGLLEYREFEPSSFTKPRIPYNKLKLSYRCFSIFSFYGNLLGFIGLMLYVRYANQVKESIHQLTPVAGFIILLLYFIFGILLSLFRTVFPPAKLFAFIDKKLEIEKLLSQAQVQSTSDSTQQSPDNSLDST